MIKYIVNRFFYILYVVFDKIGYGLSPCHGPIFYIFLFIMFPFIICYDKIFQIDSPFLFLLIFITIFSLIFLILYFTFLHKNKCDKIIKHQKPIKFYEIIILVVVIFSLFLIPYRFCT